MLEHFVPVCPDLQGLTKRRRKILIQAGLIFDTEKEKKRLEEEKRKKEREEREKQREVQEQATVMADSRFQSPLASCVLVSNPHSLL